MYSIHLDIFRIIPESIGNEKIKLFNEIIAGNNRDLVRFVR